MAAYFDQSLGDSTLVVYGLPPPWAQEYYQLLSHRYGIRVRRVADCLVSQSLLAYANSYDKISSTTAIRRYGRDIFKECADEAKRDWERQVAEGSSSPKSE